MSDKTETPPIDKSTWGDGPWQDEPDRVEFESEGFPCLIVRNPSLGTLCGYVAMPPGHPWHGKHYGDLDVEVHGGLTFADACQGHICHVPKPGAPDDVWWLGFDMGHAWDIWPGYVALTRGFALEGFSGASYKTVEYVRKECESVAAQAKAAT